MLGLRQPGDKKKVNKNHKQIEERLLGPNFFLNQVIIRCFVELDLRVETQVTYTYYNIVQLAV